MGVLKPLLEEGNKRGGDLTSKIIVLWINYTLTLKKG